MGATLKRLPTHATGKSSPPIDAIFSLIITDRHPNDLQIIKYLSCDSLPDSSMVPPIATSRAKNFREVPSKLCPPRLRPSRHAHGPDVVLLGRDVDHLLHFGESDALRPDRAVAPLHEALAGLQRHLVVAGLNHNAPSDPPAPPSHAFVIDNPTVFSATVGVGGAPGGRKPYRVRAAIVFVSLSPSSCHRHCIAFQNGVQPLIQKG